MYDLLRESLKLRFNETDIRFDPLSNGEKMLLGRYTVHTDLSLGKVSTIWSVVPPLHP
jgi:hypothetical protein